MDTNIWYNWDTKKHIFEGALWFWKRVILRWLHQDSWVSSWQYFCGFCRKNLPAESWHSNGYKLCPSSRRHLSVYEAEFIQSLLSTGKKQLVSSFNLTYRYIDDELSINNQDFDNYMGQIYPAELEIKDHREHNFCFLPRFTSFDWGIGQLHTSIYDKRDDFNFNITNFPFLMAFLSLR